MGVARAIYEYSKMGWTVLAPLSDSDKYDLVVDDGTTLLKVQVKTTRCVQKAYGKPGNRTGYLVQVATSGGNQTTNKRILRQDTDYDLLFVLADSGQCWSIPSSALIGIRNSVTVGSTSPRAKYKQYELQ